MEKNFSKIDTWEKQSLPAIANHAPQIGLFASSIELNSKNEKYHLFATKGEAVPIAFERSETMAAFVRHLQTIIATGQDRVYQPTMRVSEVLKGCGLLEFQSATYDQILIELKKSEARIVVIHDATNSLDSEPYETITRLNCIANRQGIILFWGFNVTTATDTALDCIARQHNLCQLVEASINLVEAAEEPKTVSFFSFVYGTAPHRVFYQIDERGNLAIPSHVGDLLRMHACKELLCTNKSNSLEQSRLVERLFGFFNGEFATKSFYTMISQGVKFGLLQRSGVGRSTTIKFSDVAPTRNAHRGSTALTALGDPRSKINKFHTPRKPLARFGDFRILQISKEIAQHMGGNFMCFMAKMIATGSKAFGDCMAVKSKHRNQLIILLSTNQKMVNRMQSFIGEPINAELEIVCLESPTDSELLHFYRTKANQKPFDFVLFVGLDNCRQTDYTRPQLARELALTARRRGFVCICQTNEDIFPEFENKVWTIRRLFDEANRHAFPKGYAKIQNFYLFEAVNDQRPFLGKFNEFGYKADALEFKRSLLVSKFFDCQQTPIQEIDVSETELRAARKDGLISIKNGLVSFVG